MGFPLRFIKLLTALALVQAAENDTDVCDGKVLEGQAPFVDMQEFFCTIRILDSSTALAETVLADCCIQEERPEIVLPTEAGPFPPENGTLCHRVCRVEVGDGGEDEKREAEDQLRECVRERFAATNPPQPIEWGCEDRTPRPPPTDEEMKEYENCTGKYTELTELVERTEGAFCLVPVLSSNGTFHEDVMANCCRQSEERFTSSVWEGGSMSYMSFPCYQACMVKNGLQDREQAQADFEECYAEHFMSKTDDPESYVCFRGLDPTSSPEPEDEDGIDDEEDDNTADSNDESNSNSNDREEGSQDTGEEEDSIGHQVALSTAKALALSFLTTIWQLGT